jgi:UDP:flavonoid glycosyltransferase YjiC (YdhE family)
MSTVASYVHHHGRGHWTRFAAIRTAANFAIRSISELGGADVVLPSDVPPRTHDPTGVGAPALHWAPDDVRTGLPRARLLLDALARWDVTTLVVDVSVEAALLSRLAGIAPIVVRQHGTRTDRAHRNAYDVARCLIAPYPAVLESPATPADVRARTRHVGYVVADEPDGGSPSAPSCDRDDVVVLWGAGGAAPSGAWIDDLARASRATVHVLGCRPHTTAANVIVHGWVDEPQRFLVARPTVVTTCGNNTISLAGRHACPTVIVPQDRPFAEQEHHGRQLVRLGLAVDARNESWESVLASAPATADRWSELADQFDGARRAAEVIAAQTGVAA